ncbi:hypothetical protein K8I61_16600 [bacterium]|nr:hypothetical protein [bacterium]
MAAVLAGIAIVIVVSGILICVNASSIATNSIRGQMPSTGVQARGEKPSAEIPAEIFGRTETPYSLENGEDSCNPDSMEVSRNPGVCE